jgi:hypothetical protein
VESANTLGFWEAIIFAAMYQKLGSRPFVNKVCGAESNIKICENMSAISKGIITTFARSSGF